MDFYKLTSRFNDTGRVATILVWPAPFQAAIETLNMLKKKNPHLSFTLGFANRTDFINHILEERHDPATWQRDSDQL